MLDNIRIAPLTFNSLSTSISHDANPHNPDLEIGCCDRIGYMIHACIT